MLSFKKWYPTYSCYKVWDAKKRKDMAVHMEEAWEISRLRNEESRPIVRRKPPVQHAKVKTCPHCGSRKV
jgi:hypothetical protein